MFHSALLIDETLSSEKIRAESSLESADLYGMLKKLSLGV